MELNAVPDLGFPTDFAGVVVSELVLFKGFKEYLFLFLSGFENEFKGSLEFHIHTLPQYLQAFKCGLLLSLTEGVSDRKEVVR